MEPQQRRPRPNLGCSAIGWMDIQVENIDLILPTLLILSDIRNSKAHVNWVPCQTLPLTLKEEQTEFENRMLRRKFGPKREKTAH
jgi:hypothetical protein